MKIRFTTSTIYQGSLVEEIFDLYEDFSMTEEQFNNMEKENQNMLLESAYQDWLQSVTDGGWYISE